MAGARAWLVAAVLLAAGGSAAAEEICEGCWELGGRVNYLSVSSDADLDPAGGLTVSGLFRFRPYWSLEFGLGTHPSGIEDGPDEELTFLTVAGAWTLRSSRNQRSRPYLVIGAGWAFDHISGNTVDFRSGANSFTARSDPASDNGLVLVMGAGGVTSLRRKLWLRYEVRYLQWSTFNVSHDALQLSTGLWYRF